MRYNWTKGALDAGLNQFTPPEKIVDFVSQYPGMYDACFVNPDYLALYAPNCSFRRTNSKKGSKNYVLKVINH